VETVSKKDDTGEKRMVLSEEIPNLLKVTIESKEKKNTRIMKKKKSALAQKKRKLYIYAEEGSR